MKKTGTLCGLIVIAAGFKLANDYTEPTQTLTEQVKETKPHLQASRGKHLKSYFDSDSSHYMGGMHNVALENLIKNGAESKPMNAKQLGGAHNVALQSLSNKDKLQKPMVSSWNKFNNLKTNLIEISGLCAFAFVTVMSLLYYSAFKGYKVSMEHE